MDRAGQGSLQERTRGWLASAIVIRSECDFLAIIPVPPVKRVFLWVFRRVEPVRVSVYCNVTAGDDNIGQRSMMVPRMRQDCSFLMALNQNVSGPSLLRIFCEIA